MQTTAVHTGVAVTRACDYCGISRSLRILIDGVETGAVAYGQRTEIALEPGVYSVQVAMDWCRSEPYDVRIVLGKMVELEGGVRWRGLAWVWNLFAVFCCPGRAFIVREK